MAIVDENNVVYLHWKHQRLSVNEKVVQSEIAGNVSVKFM